MACMVMLKMTLQMVNAPLPSSYSNTVTASSFDYLDSMLHSYPLVFTPV